MATYIITLTDNAKDALIRLEVVCQRIHTTFARPEMSSVHHVWTPKNRESWQAAIRAADCTAEGMRMALEGCGHRVIIDHGIGGIDDMMRENGELV